LKQIEQQITPIWLPNFPFWGTTLSDETLSPIRLEIDQIKSNFSNATSHNKNLVGNLDHSYELITSRQRIEELVLPIFLKYIHDYDYKGLNNNPDFELELSRAWVNFQQRYEFNPCHAHDGDFSFIIWIDSPYSMEEEYAVAPGAKSVHFAPGCVSFHLTNTLGYISSHDFAVDKTYNNNMLLFPSTFVHSVNPFYSTDSYRISVSGNVEVITTVL
jgi:hypothetical protein